MNEAEETVVDAPEVVNEPEIVDAPSEREAKDEPEAIGQEAETAEGEGEEPEAPVVELSDWTGDDGQTYKVPPEVVPLLLRNKDYTQKSQANAEAKRKLEEDRQEWEALKQRDEEDLRIETELHRLSDLDEQYSKIDWDRLADEDMDLARRRQFEHDRVRNQLADLKGQKDRRTQERSQAHQQSMLKRIEEAEEYAVANIPNWGAEKSREIWDYAIKDLGFDEATLRTNLDARFMKLLHKAHVGDIALKKANAAPSRKPAANVDPLNKVSGKGQTTTHKPLGEMSMEEYVAYRKKQNAA